MMGTAGANHVRNLLMLTMLFLFVLLQFCACIFHMMLKHADMENADVSEEKGSHIMRFKTMFIDTTEWYVILISHSLFFFSQRASGFIIPVGYDETLFITILVIVGFLITTVIFIATLSFLLGKYYMRMAALRYQIHEVNKYLETINLPEKDKNTIKNYYRILWEKKDGVHELPQFPELPFSVKAEISIDINIDALQSATMFRNQSDAFLRAVSSVMENVFYQSGELIYFANVIKDKMVYVVSGTIEVLSDEDNESSILILGKGTCLGESSLILTLPAKCSVKASCYTELQVLYRKDFYTLIDLFPNNFVEIREDVLARIRNARRQTFTREETQTMNLYSYFAQGKTNSKIKSIKEKLRGRIPLNPEDKYLSMYKMSDGLADIETDEIFLTYDAPWILQPDTSFHKAWEYFIVGLSAIIALVYPYYLIFNFKYYTHFIGNMMELVDDILMIDFLIIMCTAIQEKDKTITSFIQIMRRRITQLGFYLDFLCWIKLEAFCVTFAENSSNERLCYKLRVNRILKCYRIGKLINKIDHQKLTKHVVVLRITKYLIYIVMSIYWLCALNYSNTCFDEACAIDGWLFKKLKSDLNNSLFDSYIRYHIVTAFYYTLFYFTSPTFRDLHPFNISDMILASAMTIMGLYVIGYCVAELSATTETKRKIVTQYQQAYFALKQFMEEKHIPKEIIDRVERFFILQWTYDKGISMQGSLFFNANKNIKTKVEMAAKWNALANLPVLQEKDNDFLQSLVMETYILVMPPNEPLTYRGGVTGILYVILEGYCIRQTEGDLNSRIQGPGSFFGTLSALTNAPFMTSVRTLTHVKLLLIPHSALWKCASMYPRVHQHFQDILQDLELIEDVPLDSDWNTNQDIDIDELNGSFIHVPAYCKKHNESYDQPFRKLSYMYWIKFILLPVCILPYGTFLKVWMLIRVIVAVLLAFLSPYISFQYPNQPTLYNLTLLLDTIAFADLYLMLFVGYHGPKKQLIIHPLKTASHYLRGKFLFDLVLCTPWELIAEYFHTLIEGRQPQKGNEYYFIATCMIVRVFQCYRVPQFFNYFSASITKTGITLQIAKFVAIILIFINSSAAIFVTLTCDYYSRNDFNPEDFFNDTYVEPKGFMGHHFEQNYSTFCRKHSWLDRSKFRNMTGPFEIYMLAIYFCVSTVTTCGMGDITPQFIDTLILTMIIIIFGVLFFGYVFAKISSYKADWRTLQIQHQRKVNELQLFMTNENVDKEIQQNVIDRVEYRWKRSRGAEPNVILYNLNSTLHGDSVFSMYGEILSEVPIFQQVNKAFFRVAGKLLKQRYYLREERIYEVDDVVTKICIIDRGTVKVTGGNLEKDIYIGRGGVFGNLTPHHHHKISISLTPLTNVDILYMEAHNFFATLQTYPIIKEQVMNAITNTDFMRPIKTEAYDMQMNQEADGVGTRPRTFENNFIKFLQIISCWKIFRITIAPFSFIYTFFDGVCVILAYTNTVSILYEFSFRHHSLFLLLQAISSDIFFFLRLILTLHKSYEDDFGELVESNKKIIQRYFENRKLRRTVDLLAHVPFYYLAFFSFLIPGADAHLCFSTLRLFTLGRFLLFFDYYEYKSDMLLSNTAHLKILTTVIWVSLTLHCMACGWYLCSCPLTYCIENSWTSVYMTDLKDKSTIYLKCIYLMICIFTASSNSDILPVTKLEIIYLTIVMLLSNFLIGFLIGDIINTLNSTYHARVYYERRSKMMKLYLQNCKISEFQMDKLKEYTENLWKVSYGNQLPELIKDLHHNTTITLMLNVYGRHIRNAYIFKEVEETFIRQLSRCFERKIFFPGNYIVKHGRSDNSMYFIHSGEVEILTIHPNLTETIHENLGSGESFGINQGLYHGLAHHFSFRAKTSVHVVKLCFNKWEHLLEFFPNSKVTIYERAARVYV